MSSLKLSNIGQLVTYNAETMSMAVRDNVEIVIEAHQVTEVGQDLGDADTVLDCKGNLVTPGFVDPHTQPVFLDGKLIGYTAIKAHWLDTGGKEPYSTDTVDVFQEGTIYPGLK